MADLEGKVAIITGSGSGIGETTAELFAAEGASVVVADINTDAAERVAKSIVAAGGQASACTFDLGDHQSIAALFDYTTDTYGGLDAIFNNASATHIAKNLDHDIARADASAWDETFRINVSGTMLCTKMAAERIRERGRGSIINATSDAGATGDLGHPAYGAGKAAIARLTTYAAVEYGRHGIRCNAISPGLIVTPATEKDWAAGKMAEIMTRQHLMGRLGAREDIAHAAIFLASDKSSFITGQVIHVDGGLLAHAPYVADISDLMAGAGS
ncbi:glucose 1-dehydrogenase [Gordonia sp. HNM0687]|uniref:Glucose 1-dehydrogenase n=1 Tax=Gordonia mangrovi TaxID=2665643 RepID=A0A6L7GXX2_9ACTN|nr:glucose 1-dehydrogenase [Gordonia mangrovi]MXP23505.1 glucose 1-dehydrogenase [Gordonia mangrovi]UVF76601.1 glucose 1-dehydrogenase [Gordonia mangrovi]